MRGGHDREDVPSVDTATPMSALPIFLGLSYGGIWGLWGLGTWLAIPFSMNPLQPGGMFYLAGSALPSLSAIAALVMVQGWKKTRYLLKCSLAWRFSPTWYLSALLIPFAVNGINALIAVNLLGADIPSHWFASAFGIGFLLFYLVWNGLGEEFGWRGLALPALQRHLGSLGGNIGVGILWALWHLPQFLMPGSYQHGDSIPLFVLLLTCWSIVIGLLVNKSGGSILPAILFHESANFIAFSLHLPGSIYGYLVWGLAAALAIFWLPSPRFAQPWERQDGKPGD